MNALALWHRRSGEGDWGPCRRHGDCLLHGVLLPQGLRSGFDLALGMSLGWSNRIGLYFWKGVGVQTGPKDHLHQCGLKTTVLDWWKSSPINTSTIARRCPRFPLGSMVAHCTEVSGVWPTYLRTRAKDVVAMFVGVGATLPKWTSLLGALSVDSVPLAIGTGR
jgi:hypothetical protein